MIRVIYHYAIAFITLMMLIGGSISFFISTSDYVKPVTPYLMTETDFNSSGMTQKEKTYAEYKRSEMTRVKEEGLRGMISSLGWIIIPGGVFMFVSRRIRKWDT